MGYYINFEEYSLIFGFIFSKYTMLLFFFYKTNVTNLLVIYKFYEFFSDVQSPR